MSYPFFFFFHQKKGMAYSEEKPSLKDNAPLKSRGGSLRYNARKGVNLVELL